MRKLIYEYCPLNRDEVLLSLSDVIHIQSPYWHSLHAFASTPGGSNAAAGAAAAVEVAAFEKNLIYTPCSYVAANSFVIKPEEWLKIVFTCQPCDDPRPDVIYEPVAAWPTPELEIDKRQLALLIQNNSRYASVAVHQKSRLHHLLQMETLDSCFILLPHEQDEEDVTNPPPPPLPPLLPLPPFLPLFVPSKSLMLSIMMMMMMMMIE